MPRLRRPSWADLTRPPAVATPRAVATGSGVLFLGGGVLAVLSTVLPGAPTTGLGELRLLACAALAVGVSVLVAGRRLPRWANHLALVVAWCLITHGLLVVGGGPPAVADSLLYLLIVINAFCVCSVLEGLGHLLLAVVGVVTTLSLSPGVGPAQTVVCAGVTVLVCGFAGRLVRATAEVEVDALTGLVNRRGLDRRLEAALARCERLRAPLGLAIVDLDHFKAVNDREGHAAGDRLLRAVATGWRSLLPPEAVLGRSGGDEFVLLVPGATGAAVTALVGRLRESLPPGRSCSAGTAEWEPGDSASLLTNRADAALYQAKRAGRGRTREHVDVQSQTEELHRAVAAGEIEVHYQPVVDLVDGAVVGAEALVRWRHPARGLVPPAEFLPQAELSGAAVELGRFVVQRACRDAAAWPRDRVGRPRALAVNASGSELADPGYASHLQQCLHASGLAPTALVVEITEGVLDLESPTVLQSLRTLRSVGVRIAIDDFGTGYSSLARLERLEVDVLKVDRSFVAAVQHAGSPAPLVTSILGLAGALELEVVAEGVETAEQSAWLLAHGCTRAQGHLWSPAVPAADFARLLEPAAAALTT